MSVSLCVPAPQSTRGAAAGLLKVAASCKVAAAALKTNFGPAGSRAGSAHARSLSRDAHQSGGDMKFQTKEN